VISVGSTSKSGFFSMFMVGVLKKKKRMKRKERGKRGRGREKEKRGKKKVTIFLNYCIQF
jgi:hypothetical protein